MKKHVNNINTEAKYITRYTGSGLLNTVVGFFVILSAMAIGFSPMISNVTGYAVGFMMGFVLSKKFVFRSEGHFVTESIRYLGAFTASFLLNLFVLHVTLTYLNIHAVLCQIMSAIAYTICMYLLIRFFVFDIDQCR